MRCETAPCGNAQEATLKAWTKCRSTQACVLFCSVLPNSRGLSTRLRSAASSSCPCVSGLGLSAAFLRGDAAGLGLLGSGLEASAANARGDSMNRAAMSGLAAAARLCTDTLFVAQQMRSMPLGSAVNLRSETCPSSTSYTMSNLSSGLRITKVFSGNLGAEQVRWRTQLHSAILMVYPMYRHFVISTRTLLCSLQAQGLETTKGSVGSVLLLRAFVKASQRRVLDITFHENWQCFRQCFLLSL